MTVRKKRDRDVTDLIETVYDAELVSQIQALAPAQTDPMASAAIKWTLERMKMNDLSIEALFKAAENSDWKQPHNKTRGDAICALGDKGTPDDIKRIEAIKPWDKASLDPGANEDAIQFILGEYKTNAANRIRQRFAKAAAAKP